MRHKTHAEFWRAMPHSAYPKNTLIRLIQKIIAKTFLNRVVRPPIRASNVLLYSLMLPVGPASRRSSPQGKRPTSQAEPCPRDHNGSRCRIACPTWDREAAEGARGVVRSLDLFPRWGS